MTSTFRGRTCLTHYMLKGYEQIAIRINLMQATNQIDEHISYRPTERVLQSASCQINGLRSGIYVKRDNVTACRCPLITIYHIDNMDFLCTRKNKIYIENMVRYKRIWDCKNIVFFVASFSMNGGKSFKVYISGKSLLYFVPTPTSYRIRDVSYM